MKKIIDGKLYDTETAECLGFYPHFDGNTFHYLREALYRTKRALISYTADTMQKTRVLMTLFRVWMYLSYYFLGKMQCYG